MAVGDAFSPHDGLEGTPADRVVGPPLATPARLLALLRHVLARLRDPLTSLCVPLRSLRLGIVGGRFQMVLRFSRCASGTAVCSLKEVSAFRAAASRWSSAFVRCAS